jgi:hypothetical protein
MDPNLSQVPQRRIPIDNLIEKLFLHPQWNESTMNADLALIRLKNNIVYTSIKDLIFYSLYAYKKNLLNI